MGWFNSVNHFNRDCFRCKRKPDNAYCGDSTFNCEYQSHLGGVLVYAFKIRQEDVPHHAFGGNDLVYEFYVTDNN